MRVAVIPARGGSKRIPRKNIRPFLGVPMLARTIRMLAAARIFERIVVSTDDDEIAMVAREAGADVPFMRPAELANDFVGTLPVIAHAILELDSLGTRADYVCCAYPAAVLSVPDDLQAAWRLVSERDVDYVFTATSFSYPIQRALRRVEDGCQMFWPEHADTRSQDLEHAYHDAGQFYFGRRESWLENRPPFGPRAVMLQVPSYRVQDIDTTEDWERAELIFRLLDMERHAL